MIAVWWNMVVVLARDGWLALSQREKARTDVALNVLECRRQVEVDGTM